MAAARLPKDRSVLEFLFPFMLHAAIMPLSFCGPVIIGFMVEQSSLAYDQWPHMFISFRTLTWSWEGRLGAGIYGSLRFPAPLYLG